MIGLKLEQESDEEYDARCKAAEGKFFLRAVMRDDNQGNPYHIAVESPDFEYANHNPAIPPMGIMQALMAILVQRETEK